MSKLKFKRVQDITTLEMDDAARILVRRLHGIPEPDYHSTIKRFLHQFKMVHMYTDEYRIDVIANNKDVTEEDEKSDE